MKRQYEATHPHLAFTLDLRHAPYDLWMLLGEAQSKIEHIAGAPLSPEVAQRLHQVYLAKGALATTAIEGNTLTDEEALERVQGSGRLSESREYLGVEIDNVVRAVKDIFNGVLAEGDKTLTVDEIAAYNRRVLHGLENGPEVRPGAVRQHEVTAGRYRGSPAEDCRYLLERLCAWLNSPEFVGKPSDAIAFAVLRAIVAHLYLAWIHPFGDGNGRTVRLVEFRVLVSAGVPSPAAHLLSNHYNRTRERYYQRLEESTQRQDGAIRFIQYAVQGFVDELREQLDEVRKQQMSVMWLNYVHESLRGEAVALRRRRHLVLDLTALGRPVPPADMPSISARVALDYAAVTEKTLSRDVSQLINNGYLRRTPSGVVANSTLITAFLPARHVT